ncbi:MAG: hypothetical protein RL497_1827 [Pseudomonadota bacterium]|jgi:hypothetical protein
MKPWDKTPEWREDDIHIDFSKAQSVLKLDGAAHGLSHHLKAVDFVVEWADQLWLLEIKDPENSTIPEQHRQHQLQKFQEKLQSDRLINEELYPKLRDSLIYISMNRGIAAKKLIYITLIGLESLDAVALAALKNTLWQKEWLKGPKNGWQKPFAVMCMNLTQWNRLLPHCPARRIGESLK